MAKPWLTSDDLIESVKRKISFPISQVTFTEEDILAFANEEMAISQVPSILQFHEEYLVTYTTIPIEPYKNNYPIPERAIGMRLRDVFWQDSQNNLFEMTRINSDDRAFFQANIGSNQSIHKFYLQGNDVVLTPAPTANPTGSLVLVYFIRPNQLVKNEKAATISNFVKNIVVDNTSLIAGDTVTLGDIILTAVAGAPSSGEFQIGGTSIVTATNMVSAINTDGTYSASNGTPSTATVEVLYDDLTVEFSTSNTTSFNIEQTQSIKFDTIPSNITNGSVIDILQTKPGHKIKNFGIVLSNSAISGMNITLEQGDIPDDLVVGDYICSENECVIPQLPSDLHNSLAERTAARILASIGDVAGLNERNQKIQEIEQRQGTLLDNRVEGAPQKITARHSLLRYGKMGQRRRF